MYPNGASSAMSSGGQQPAAICSLKTPGDAIQVLEGVRLGLLPRVTRRLTGHERNMIRAGTVWVWEEEECNMKRWTDGRRWGASRVGGGGFLVYNESTEAMETPGAEQQYHPYSDQAPRRFECLVKQTYSTSMTERTGEVKKWHVVAYSNKYQNDGVKRLPLPHELPALSELKVIPGIWPEWEHQRENRIQTPRSPPKGLPSSTPLVPMSGAFPTPRPPVHVAPQSTPQFFPQTTPVLNQAHPASGSGSSGGRTSPNTTMRYDNMMYTTPSFYPSPRQDPYDPRQYSPQQPYGQHPYLHYPPPTDRYPLPPQAYYDQQRQPIRGPFPSSSSSGSVPGPITPNGQYFDERRERSPTRTFGNDTFPYYPNARDRYPDTNYDVKPVVANNELQLHYDRPPPPQSRTSYGSIGNNNNNMNGRLPPTPVSAVYPELGSSAPNTGRNSPPKLPVQGVNAGNGEAVNGDDLTLPPLRVLRDSVDTHAQGVDGIRSSPTEDARQLAELGARPY